MTTSTGTEDLLRTLAPRVLAALVRRTGDLHAAEDAVQEALLAAVTQWPVAAPDRPLGWLVTVASRRLVDRQRGEIAGRKRERAAATLTSSDRSQAPPADTEHGEQDDTLTLLMLCCHPSLTAASQVALTLRAVGGLSTAEIARAFLVPEATMAQRISRAKQTIRAAGAQFRPPPAPERAVRLASVLHALYLVFTEGHTASSGEELARSDLSREAIRLTRLVRDLEPADGEVAGLLALMLLTEARAGARTAADGRLVPLAEQDRRAWDPELTGEGLALIATSLASAPVGPYQLQAAVAAVHAEAERAEDTDWPQIVALYRLLAVLSPNPMVTLNLAVAVAMVEGPRAGLALSDELVDDPRLRRHHRLVAVRAHLLEQAGDHEEARAAYRAAAALTASGPEQRYLEERAARVGGEAPRTSAG